MSEPMTFPPEVLAEIEEWEERALTPEEFTARIAAPWTEHELEDFDALIAWFNRRYPTPAERLRATRLLMAQLPAPRR